MHLKVIVSSPFFVKRECDFPKIGCVGYTEKSIKWGGLQKSGCGRKKRGQDTFQQDCYQNNQLM